MSFLVAVKTGGCLASTEMQAAENLTRACVAATLWLAFRGRLDANKEPAMAEALRFLHHPTSQPCRAVHQLLLENDPRRIPGVATSLAKGTEITPGVPS